MSHCMQFLTESFRITNVIDVGALKALSVELLFDCTVFSNHTLLVSTSLVVPGAYRDMASAMLLCEMRVAPLFTKQYSVPSNEIFNVHLKSLDAPVLGDST